ncbi:MAG: DUF721 domain-containing protein [Hyphomicrobiales bacterium]|nr:DUF721 domain-containing protein [Hyphomicrobiales bacterium]
MYTSAKKTPRKRPPARKVSEFVGKIIEPVLSRRSGMTIDLLNAWPELVGDDYCDFTRPQKINWPNRAHEDDPFKPGILVVACDSSRALYFQHDLSRICERVNVFFGFAAIAKLKIVQKPVQKLRLRKSHDPQNIPVQLDENRKKRLNAILDHISDPDLKQKLEKLGQGVMSNAISKK